VSRQKPQLDEAAVVAALKEKRNVRRVAAQFGVADRAITKIRKAHQIELRRQGNPRKEWGELIAEFEKVRDNREALESLATKHNYRNVASLRNAVLHKAGRLRKTPKVNVLLTQSQCRFIVRQNLDEHQAALRARMALGKEITADDVKYSLNHWRAVEEQSGANQ